MVWTTLNPNLRLTRVCENCKNKSQISRLGSPVLRRLRRVCSELAQSFRHSCPVPAA